MLRFASPFATKLALSISVLGLGVIGTAAVAQDYGYDPYATNDNTGAQGSGLLQPFFSPVPVKSAKWVAIISANGNYYPSFRGSDKYVFTPYPMVSIRRGGEARHPEIPGDGFDIDAVSSKLAPVPLPAGVALMGSAFLGMLGLRRSRKV